jgi:AraC-like DNA-binding protein
VKTRHGIRQVRYDAPAPYGVEVMTLADLRAMAPPGYLLAPQRPNFHLLILATGGETTHAVDFHEHRIGPGESLWVRPGQVQRFDADAGSADLVLVQPDFLIPGTIAERIAADRFAPIRYDSRALPGGSLGQARRALRAEYDAALRVGRAPDPVRTETLRHLLSILILRLAGNAPSRAMAPDSLYERFRERLERDFAEAHDVDHYARALGYSTRSLARATRAAADRTPKQIIEQRLALEAARLLAHSDRPVATIAFELGFRDASNFSSFFTAQMKKTPTQFRATQRP